MRNITFYLALFFVSFTYAQDDLLNTLETESQEALDNEVVGAVFKSVKIVNLESTKLVAKGQFDLLISHRFGAISNGIDDLFGLDQASTRIQGVYGLTDWLQVSFSRSKFQKTYDAAVKYSLFKQEKDGFPLNIVGYHSVNVNTNLDKDLLPGLSFSDRFGYAHQVLLSRKLTKRISFQLSPTFFYDNFVFEDAQDNAQFALGVGGRVKMTNRLSLTADYGVHLNRANNSVFNNPLAIGVDIETGGHVFQLHFSNAQAIYENGFLGQARGDWLDGDIFFGFNVVRSF